MKNVRYEHSEEVVIVGADEAKEYNDINGSTIIIDEEDHYHADNEENDR